MIIIESNQHYGLRERYQCLCEVDHRETDGENDKQRFLSGPEITGRPPLTYLV